MTLSDLVRGTGEWLRGEGEFADIVVSSRVRLARNLAGHSFLASASPSDRTEVYATVRDQIATVPAGENALVVDLLGADEIDRNFLVERHLISRHQATAEGSRGVAIWPDETAAVMINEEDHLRIQGLRSGLQLEDLWSQINALDDELSRRLDFAYDKKLGYLTACPTNVGTGIRVSVLVHLPALKLTQEIERVSRATKDLRLAVRGLYGEGTEAVGDLYQISNQVTLGRSEDDIIRDFGTTVIPRIVEYERTARESLARTHPQEIDDRIWRAYGLLANARLISSEETITLLSHLRLGLHMHRFDKADAKTLNDLFLLTQPAHLQKLHGAPLDGIARARLRAEMLREKLGA
jgi:protein arginine kinase